MKTYHIKNFLQSSPFLCQTFLSVSIVSHLLISCNFSMSARQRNYNVLNLSTLCLPIPLLQLTQLCVHSVFKNSYWVCFNYFIILSHADFVLFFSTSNETLAQMSHTAGISVSKVYYHTRDPNNSKVYKDKISQMEIPIHEDVTP